MIKCPGWLVPVPHDNQLASNEPPLKGMEEEVCGIAWLCDPDRAVGERNTETNDGIGTVERLRTKNLSPVAKRMESTNKVLHADLARGDRKEKSLGSGKNSGIFKDGVVSVGLMVQWC
jgi:hypothetical protein